MAFFFDSSAGVKYYVTEPGTTWVRQLLEGPEAIFLAEISLAEVAAALGMLERLRRISRRHRLALWEQFDRDCTERPASRRFPVPLREPCWRQRRKSHKFTYPRTPPALPARTS